MKPIILVILLMATPWRHAHGQVPELPTAARIIGYTVTGSTDPQGRIESFIEGFSPSGSYFIEPGPLDYIAGPVSTVARLQQALTRLGYTSSIQVQTAADGVRLTVALQPVERVRQIFVAGNWPLRQEEILRRLSLRPGQPIDAAGPLRDERLAAEKDRVLEYLHGQGYLDARVSMQLRAPNDGRRSVNLTVRIALGWGYPIGPISVTGNRHMATEDIVDDFLHMDWRFLWTRPLPFKLSLLQEDTQELAKRYRSEGFAAVRIIHDFDPARSVDPVRRDVRLGLVVDERKQIRVAFEGNSTLDDDDLRAALTIFSRGAYDNHEATASADAIARLYRSRGHMFAKAKWRREVLSKDADRLVFSIEEGPRLRVKDVTFVGHRNLSTDTLSDLVRTKVFPLLGSLGIGEGGYASLLQLEIDQDRIIDAYAALGRPAAKATCTVGISPSQYFPLATLNTPGPEWKAARELFVRFQIDEGPLVAVSAVRIVMDPPGTPLPRDEAFLRASLLDTRVGGPFRPAAIRQDTARLQRLLGDEGYPHAEVDPDPGEGLARVVTWTISLGPRTRIGPVFIRGNFTSRESTILEWVSLRPGNYLTTTDLDRSQRNLALIQLFANASPISFPAEATSGDTVPMVIEVEERHDHFGIIHPGLGGSTEQKDPNSDFPIGFYAALGYEHRNLFGQGWTFLGRGEAGNSQSKATADFLDPRIGESLFRLELSSAYLQQKTIRLGDVRSGGGSIGLGREMYPGVDAVARYSLRRTLHTEPLLRGGGADATQTSVRLGTIVGSLGLELTWQRLDNPLVPSRGFRVNASIFLAAPTFSFDTGRDTFVKLRSGSLVVMPIWGRLSVRHSVRYDQGFPLSGASVLPRVERFFAGGDTTLRGFDLDRARSEAIPIQLGPGLSASDYRPVGGSLRLLHNLDFQFALAGPLFVAVFLDSGVVADSFSGLSTAAFRHGVGIAPISLRLPIGDISFGWAWPLDPRPGDSRNGRLVFNVGLMF